MKKLIMINIVLVIILFIALFSQIHAAADTIKIGVSIGLTGKYGKMADMQKKAYLLWEEHINKRGGLRGEKVKMIIDDDKSNKETAKKIYKRFIVEDKLDFVIGPYSSGITDAIMPIAEENGYPLLAAGAASDKLWKKGYKHLFGIFIPASRYAVGFLEMAAMNGINDIAIVYADDLFSSSIGMGAKEWGTKFGLNVVLFEGFKKGTHDLTALAEKVKAVKARALIVCGHYEESVDMIESLRRINWRPANYFATVGPAMEIFYKKLQKDAEMVFSSSQWEPGVMYQSDDHEIFLKPFKQKYKIEPSYHAANAFAACQILEMAIKRANSFDREKIRNALSTMDAMSVIGRYGVDKNGMQIKHFPINVQWQKGKKVIVWPDDLAEAKPIIK